MSEGMCVDRRQFMAGVVAASIGGASLALADRPAYAEEGASDATEADFSNPVEVFDCDVIVVGTGTAGMVAAVQAMQEGANVVVLEKTAVIGGQSQAAEVMFGCNSRLQKELGLEYTDYELLTHECEFHNWHVDRELWSQIVKISGESIDWLLDNVEPYGAGFSAVLGGIDAPTVAHMFGSYTAADDGATYIKGAGISHALLQVLNEAGVSVMTECEAKSVIMNGDVVAGLYAQTADGIVRFNAPTVILACGGFTGSSEMIDELGRNSSRMMCRGYATNVGDGIRMAREVGADHRGAMCAQLMGPSMPFPDTNSYRYANAAAVLMGSSLWVNHHGVRFVPEAGLIYTVTANAIDMQDDVYSVFDTAYINACAQMETGENLATYFTPGTLLDQVQAELDELLADGADYVFKSDTIEGLAEAMGVPAENLVANVERYNELCELGEDQDFGKNPALISPIAEGPFYACKVYTNLLCTGGGVRIDSNARVLRPGSEPIPGLYCAGCDCDGFMGETYGVNLPGSTQGIALCTGRLAGLHAAGYVKE